MNPLAQAIADFETAQANLANADGLNTTAQQKLDSANAAAAAAAIADRDAVTAYNANIDTLVAALQAARRPSGGVEGNAQRN